MTSTSCSKIVNGENIFNTVYIHLGAIRAIWASVVLIWTKVTIVYSDFDLDQALVYCKNRTIGCR